MLTTAIHAGCLLLAACGDAGQPPPALGTLERDRIVLVAEAGEPVVHVAVTEGDYVAAGTELLRLDPSRTNAQLARALAERAAATAQLAEATTGPRREAIMRARSAVTAARSRTQTARSDHERALALARVQFTSPSELDRLAARVTEAAAQQQGAEAELAELLAGSRSERLDLAHATLAATEAAVAELEVRAGRLVVHAPVAGRIEALPFSAGEQPAPGATVAVLLADGRTFARVHVPAAVRNTLQAGATATIHVDGLTKPLTGRLRYVAHEAAFTPFYALTQHDRSRLSWLAEVDVVDGVDGVDALPTGVAVEVFFNTNAAPTP